MNHYKKFLSAAMALTLTVSLFSGCGANSAPEAVPVETTAAAEPAVTPATDRSDALIASLEKEVDRMLRNGGVDLHEFDNEIRSVDFSVMPAAYDLRDRGFVPPVKNQRSYGTCWGFASVGASEISILAELGITAEQYAEMTGEPMNLSEKHLTWFANGALPALEDYPEGEYPYPGLENQAGEGHYIPAEETQGQNNRYTGGMLTYTASMYAAGIGPALGSEYPYVANDGSDSTAADWALPEEARFDIAAELESSYILPSPASVDENGQYVYNEYGTYSIKNELLHGRAVSICYYADMAMDPDAELIQYADSLMARGIPCTREEAKNVIRYIIYKSLTLDELTVNERAVALKGLLVRGGMETVQAANEIVDAMTEEEIKATLLDMEAAQQAEEEAAEEAEEEIDEEIDEETDEETDDETDSQEDEIDPYALAEKLGLGDLDEFIENYERKKAAEGENYMNIDTYAQYTDNNLVVMNHGVTIVGWDDNYAVENFLEDKQPPAPGAWIARNSWGDDYGNEGYFYLSYYDQTICLPESYDFVTTYKAGAPKSVSIVGMDYMPTSSYPSMHMEEGCSYGNVFTMDPGENVLRYISVLCGDLDAEITAEVYLLNENAVVPSDGILLDRVVKDLRYGGYYRIPLSHDFAIPEGSRIGVVVTQRVNTGDTVKFAIPYALATGDLHRIDFLTLFGGDPDSGKYAVGRIGQGESWVYQGGQWYDWADVIADLKETNDQAQYFEYDNLGIKVYAYSLAELEGLHQFKEGVAYHGMTMRECADCSYCVVHP